MIDSFSNFGWSVASRSRNGLTITNSIENFLPYSKRKPNLFETDDGKDFVNKFVFDFSMKNNFKWYCRYTCLEAVFAERFNRTIRDLPGKLVFERGNANWIDVLPNITKHYFNRIHSSTKLTPIEGSLKNNEGYIYHSLLEKRKEVKPKFKIQDLVRTANLKQAFSKWDSTNWSYKMNKVSESFNDTIPSYRIHKLPELFNETLLKTTKLTMKENDSVIKALNLK